MPSNLEWDASKKRDIHIKKGKKEKKAIMCRKKNFRKKTRSLFKKKKKEKKILFEQVKIPQRGWRELTICD